MRDAQSDPIHFAASSSRAHPSAPHSHHPQRPLPNASAPLPKFMFIAPTLAQTLRKSSLASER